MFVERSCAVPYYCIRLLLLLNQMFAARSDCLMGMEAKKASLYYLPRSVYAALSSSFLFIIRFSYLTAAQQHVDRTTRWYLCCDDTIAHPFPLIPSGDGYDESSYSIVAAFYDDDGTLRMCRCMQNTAVAAAAATAANIPLSVSLCILH